MLLSASSTSTLTYCRRSATRELWLCRKLAPRSDCRLWNKLIPLTMRIRAQVTHKTVLYSGSRWRCALSTVKYILGSVLVGDRLPARRAGQPIIDRAGMRCAAAAALACAPPRTTARAAAPCLFEQVVFHGVIGQ